MLESKQLLHAIKERALCTQSEHWATNRTVLAPSCPIEVAFPAEAVLEGLHLSDMSQATSCQLEDMSLHIWVMHERFSKYVLQDKISKETLPLSHHDKSTVLHID